MFGKKCTSCEVTVGSLFGKKNAGTEERPLCNNCFEEEVAKEKAEKEQCAKEQRETELLIQKCDEHNAKNSDKVMDVDGNVYQSVNIGNQIWTVENLRTTKYNDGTSIPHIKDGSKWKSICTPGYCFYDNSTTPEEQHKWGALYNWYAVNTSKLVPAGWRVPTDADWYVLEKYLIANGYNWDGKLEGNKIGKSLAAMTDWSNSNSSGASGNDPSCNNRSGFSALPGGSRNSGGLFANKNTHGNWWSATDYAESHAYYRSLYYGTEHLYRDNYGASKESGFSVRLVRDN